MNSSSKHPLFLGALSLLTGVIALALFFGDNSFDASSFDRGWQGVGSLPDHSEIALEFELRDPEQAPEGIRERVMRGHRLMMDTHNELPQYVGNSLKCTNCHFSCGNSTGGRGGGIPLAGVAHLYPAYNARSKKVITLKERINGCFMRSMNGLPLPEESEEMAAFIAYLEWISSECPVDFEIPWRGIPRIASTGTPSRERGEKVFALKCSHCHGDEGEGGVKAPPLWGPYSFNDGAGMNDLGTFASFVYHNMPYGSPELTPEEAYDVAAFVTTQPRGKFKKKKKS